MAVYRSKSSIILGSTPSHLNLFYTLSCVMLCFFISSSATITTINHDEVLYKRLDGSKSKLYISQLQKGKYTIKHS